MNRYTFKIYDKKLKEFNINSLEDFAEDDYWYDGETTVWDVLYDCTHEQEKFVAMQCTGLQDRDGNYIFENDKIRGLRHHNKKQVIIEGFVEYNEFLARYDVSGNYYNGNQLSAFANVEIIGNKFDKEVE